MTSIAANTDFRRSNHERSHSESSLWIDDYLNIGLNADELLDSQLRDGELNLLAPFEDGEDLQSALSQFIPEGAFSEFEAVEPVDIETVEAEQLFESTKPHDTCSTEVPSKVIDRRRKGKRDNQSSSQNVSPSTVHSDQEGFAQPALPTVRCKDTPSPKKPGLVASPNMWLGAHPVAPEIRKSSKKSKSKSSNQTVEKKDKVRPEKEKQREAKDKTRLENDKARQEKDKLRPEKDRKRSEKDKSRKEKDRAPKEKDPAPKEKDEVRSEQDKRVRLEGVLVPSHNQSDSSASKNRKIVPQALLDKLKAASKKASRQSILISAPITQQAAKPYHVSLDHDYCGDLMKGEKDDLEVQPMELEPEHERGVGRIEVLPDLSLAARKVEKEQGASHEGSPPVLNVEDAKDNHVFDDCAIVVNEEVVTSLEIGSASSDSGIENCVRPDEYDSENGSGRGWRDERSRKSRRSSPSSSDCSSDASDDSRRNTSRRKRRRSSSRRGSSRSRSPSPRKSYGSKRRRNYSRDSSPESNSGSDDRRSYREKSSHGGGRSSNPPVRRERKNIWAMSDKPKSFPRMPPLNKPGEKTIMQSALEEIERGGDRQVLYVGQIQEGTTRSFIREKFDRFGPIAEVSLHFRETGENYAFVTFHQPKDAYYALDNAALLPDFKLCFGGRRQFCGRKWSDLDNEQERAYLKTGAKDLDKNQDDFDSLLNEIRSASKRK